jgi:hypothetical protein
MNETGQDLRARYRQLDTFLGAYLYESWSQDYVSPDDAFSDYLADAAVEELQEFLDEVNNLLGSDERLRQAVGTLSRNFSPRADYGWDERSWLLSLRERAESELRRRRPIVR